MDAESSAPDLARAFHRAVTTQNWDLLRDILDPAVTWSFPGSNILSGVVRGIDGVIGQAQRIGSFGVSIALEYILIGHDPNTVIVQLHNTAQRRDERLDEHLGTVCRVRNGRIISADTFLSDIANMNEFFTA